MPASATQHQTDHPTSAVAHMPGSDLYDSLQKALASDDNVLIERHYPAQKEAFLDSLESKKNVIEAIVRLNLGVKTCHLSDRQVWKSGSFNAVLPILISQSRTVYMRIPFPHRIGENQFPGNVEEKLQTEIATYIWLQKNCPDIPIPELHAFGLPNGSMFTEPLHTPFWERTVWSLKRLGLFLLRRSVPVHIKRTTYHSIPHGFLLISEARGKKLAGSWMEHYQDEAYRERLFRSLARISLSLNAVPLSRIGSLKLQADGSITLCNRPLSVYFQMLENEGISTGIPRERTYAQIESYLSDLLSLQDNKIRHQPHAIHDQEDGEMQLAALTTLRATMHHFIRPEHRDGPFFLHLTDLHQQNIFVDQNWNIQTIIDLEWAHTLPLEMKLPPFWLSSRKSVDGFDTQAAITEYQARLEEFWAIYEAEERNRNGNAIQVQLQRNMWARGSFWYFQAVRVPKGMYTLFNRHIQPLFNRQHSKQKAFDDILHWYWTFDAQHFLKNKLENQREYAARVRETFQRAHETKL